MTRPRTTRTGARPRWRFVASAEACAGWTSATRAARRWSATRTPRRRRLAPRTTLPGCSSDACGLLHAGSPRRVARDGPVGADEAAGHAARVEPPGTRVAHEERRFRRRVGRKARLTAHSHLLPWGLRRAAAARVDQVMLQFAAAQP